MKLKGRKMILQTEGASIATRSMSTSVDENGNFCFKVSPGTHTIQVRKRIYRSAINNTDILKTLINQNKIVCKIGS